MIKILIYILAVIGAFMLFPLIEAIVDVLPFYVQS